MKISIVIPSFNQGRFIEQTICSVLDQKCNAEVELIVIDADSSDNTRDILEKYDDRIAYWVSEKDRGQSHALNKGFSKCTGDIYAWICADDYYLDAAFYRVEEFFSENPQAQFIYGDGLSVDENSKVLNDIISGPVLDYDNFVNYNYVYSTSSFWTKELWDKSGGFIDESNYWTMDWELFIRMSREADLVYKAGKVAALRKHADAKTQLGTSQFTNKRNKEIYNVSLKHGGIFAFNCRVYPWLKLASFSSCFRALPKPLYSLLFRLFHIPISLTSKSRHSIFYNGKRK